MDKENFNYQKYRQQLAADIKKEPDKDRRHKILSLAAKTEEYQKAKLMHQEKREKFLTQKKAELPILKYAKEIKEIIANNETAVIVGETGSGKTTQIPLFLLEAMGPEDKVAITQPRRVAARSVARFVAKKVGCRLGEEVGYQVRFDDKTTVGTRINFMTDGILLRKIQEDPLLREYAAVMVDEAHERSLNIDFALGLLKRLQDKRIKAGLPPLKIIVTSATLEKEKFSHYFDKAPMVEVPGRLYPVDIHYEREPIYDYTKAAAEKVKMIVEQNQEGDILIFMPGQQEIDKTITEIESFDLPNLVILPLYGQMSPEEQDKIFIKIKKRKVIVATNIAETSVTVPGIRHVIDSGLIKQIEYDPLTGIETLAARPHAQSGCTQRAGRAGRLAPGKCWRLYTEEGFKNRREFQVPEMQRSNLAHIVLSMKKIGIDDIKSFNFIDPPEPAALEQALETLKTLGALDAEGKLTKIGKIMAELPLEPQIARMVIEAEKYNCVETICTVAAFLGLRSVFVRPKGKEFEADSAHQRFKNSESDFLALLKVWQEYEANHYSGKWARDNFLHAKVLAEVRQVRYQLFRALKRNGIRASESQDAKAIGKSIAAGLVENLMEYDYRHSYRRVKDDKSGIYIHPSSGTFGNNPEFFVAAEIVKTSKPYARVIQTVNPEWIKDIAPQFVREELYEIYYDKEKDKVISEFNLFLKGKYTAFGQEKGETEPEKAVEVFAQALVKRQIDFSFINHNQKVLETISDLWRRSEGAFKLFTEEDLKGFYIKHLNGIATKKELELALSADKINLELNLNQLISPQEQAKIRLTNPDLISILGREYKVHYKYNWQDKTFIALVELPTTKIFQLNKMPTLPSGRQVTLRITQGDDVYAQFEGNDLEQLKQKAKQFLIKEQWEEWQSAGQAPPKEQLKDFNPLGQIPSLPEPIQFGIDPETKEPLYAYPAITYEYYYGEGNKYFIKYFSSRQQADEAQKKTLEKIREIRIEQQKKEEREKFLVPAQELLKKVKTNFTDIYYNYESFGLLYKRKIELEDNINQAERILRTEPKEALEILYQVEREINQAFAYKKQRQEAQEKAEAAINHYYQNCPLCGQFIEDGQCTNPEHQAERIDFDVDENGYKIGSVILSQIITNKGKVIAQMLVSDGNDNYCCGDIYILKGAEIENGWRGEPFDSVKFTDFGKILSLKEAKQKEEKIKALRREKELAEARAYYQEDLEYAKQQVKEGYWRQGRFRKGKHPKTGDEQWEITWRTGDMAVTYVVDRYGPQPTDENFKYFFQEKRTLVDLGKIKVILVQLKRPFPEDKPEPEINNKKPPSLEALEKLKQKFNKR